MLTAEIEHKKQYEPLLKRQNDYVMIKDCPQPLSLGLIYSKMCVCVLIQFKGTAIVHAGSLSHCHDLLGHLLHDQ